MRLNLQPANVQCPYNGKKKRRDNFSRICIIAAETETVHPSNSLKLEQLDEGGGRKRERERERAETTTSTMNPSSEIEMYIK
jgi:hypothetical protein